MYEPYKTVLMEQSDRPMLEPVSPVVLPAGQAVHAVAREFGTEPAPHIVHCVFPNNGCTEPAGHGIHGDNALPNPNAAAAKTSWSY